MTPIADGTYLACITKAKCTTRRFASGNRYVTITMTLQLLSGAAKGSTVQNELFYDTRLSLPDFVIKILATLGQECKDAASLQTCVEALPGVMAQVQIKTVDEYMRVYYRTYVGRLNPTDLNLKE